MNAADLTVKALLEEEERCPACGSNDIETDGDYRACLHCTATWAYDGGEVVDLSYDYGDPYESEEAGYDEFDPYPSQARSLFRTPDPYFYDPEDARPEPPRRYIAHPDYTLDFRKMSGLPEPAPISLADKRVHQVFEHGPFIIIKMPADEQFIRREGWQMNHCLAVAYREYCERLRRGKQIQFSLVDTRDELPKVNFEVSLEESSYSGPVNEPVVTQIRGIRNQCPPLDEYLPALVAFFETHPEWKVSGHGVRNFDGRVDGDRVMARWKELQRESAENEDQNR